MLKLNLGCSNVLSLNQAMRSPWSNLTIVQQHQESPFRRDCTALPTVILIPPDIGEPQRLDMLDEEIDRKTHPRSRKQLARVRREMCHLRR